MSECRATLLTDRGALRVTGPDAAKLLQGVITNDIDKVQRGAAVHTGLLTPQGKILFDFFVVKENGGYLIEIAKDMASDIAKRLSFYKLRADVEIAEAPEITVAAVWDGDPRLPPGAIGYADPRWPELGLRVLLPAGTAVADVACGEAGEEAYHGRRIAFGVPEGGRDYAFGDTFPHEALFDQLNGVDFDKGCFVGQEVVSRMQHRGTVRKRVVPVEGNAALHAGAAVKAGDLPLGTIGSVDGTKGLAMLRLDRAEEAASKGTPFMADDARLTLHRPAFAQFDVPAGPPA